MLAAALLALSATAPVSLWLVADMSTGPKPSPMSKSELFGLVLVFGAFPRVVAMPVVFLVLAIAFLLARDRVTRALLACALAVEAVPLLLLVRHFARVLRY